MYILSVCDYWWADSWLPELMANQGHAVDIIILGKDPRPKFKTSGKLRVFTGSKADQSFIIQDIRNFKLKYDLLFNLSTNIECAKLVNHIIASSPNRPLVYGNKSPVLGELENDRTNFKRLCKELNILTPKYQQAENIDELIEMIPTFGPCYIKPHKFEYFYSRWLAMPMTDKKLAVESFKHAKTLSGTKADFKNFKFIIEDKIEGREIAIGNYFNGRHFTGPWMWMSEYKKMLAGDVGPNIDEPGVHVSTIPPKYLKADLPAVLRKFESYLKERQYVGHFGIDFIVENGTGDLYAIEPDCRYPYPACACFFRSMLEQGIDLAQFHYNLAQGGVINEACNMLSTSHNISWNPPKHMIGALLFTLGVPDCSNQSFRAIIGGWPVLGVADNQTKVFPYEIEYDPELGDYRVQRDIQGDGSLLSIAGIGNTVKEAIDDYRNILDNVVQYPFKVYRSDLGVKQLGDYDD